MRYYQPINSNSYLVEVHIADIHFGAIDSAKELNILYEQFLKPISTINFDLLSIDGDIFDKKFMANSDPIKYAMQFVDMCVNLCITKQATLVIISGTESHDAGQLILFDHYREDPRLDIRIVNHARFELIKGLKVLCIPEEYGRGEEYYRNLLSNEYDTCFMHGTVVGSVYGAVKEDLGSTKYPVFSINSFDGCKGPIICGHVHKAMCLNGYIYYVSNPVRYKFGEEEEKGYAIVFHDRVSRKHYYRFMPIESFRYDTIDIRTLETVDPDKIINHLNYLLSIGIDNIRIDFSSLNEPTVQKIIEQYYINNPSVSVKRYIEKNSPEVNATNEIQQKYADLDFLLDPTLDSYTKFVHFINHNMGKQYITVEQLKKVLAGGEVA